MSQYLGVLLLALPGLPVAAGLVAGWAGPVWAARITCRVATLAAILAVGLAAVLLHGGPQTFRWAPAGGGAAFAVSLRLDVVSAVMGVLVSFLGAVILRFSQNFLAGEPGRARFFSWMSLTLGSVLAVMLADQLMLLWLAWVATSLCLHQLLLQYPTRAGAVFAARKKFVVSRIGDVCLLAAALGLHAHYGTFELGRIFAAVAQGDSAGLAPFAFLLAACAMLKSAQFPFHTWLPDTMETPTPVSAFMHAGIVNAGGFLVVRMAPLFRAVPSASALLAIAGAFTAAFGAIVMLAQPSVKRALAYSTVAQMGFMMLQCGLGAYGLALIHIAGHSLYKAHAFLSAGSTVGAVPRAAVPLRTPALTVGLLTGALLVTLGATALHALAPTAPVHPGIFGVVLTVALAYGIGRVRSAAGGFRATARVVAAAAVIAAISLSLHVGAARLFPTGPMPRPPPVLLAAVSAVFVGLFIFQSLLWRANLHPLGRRLYVHALNGFYLGTLFNRWLGRLWPRAARPV